MGNEQEKRNAQRETQRKRTTLNVKASFPQKFKNVSNEDRKGGGKLGCKWLVEWCLAVHVTHKRDK